MAHQANSVLGRILPSFAPLLNEQDAREDQNKIEKLDRKRILEIDPAPQGTEKLPSFKSLVEHMPPLQQSRSEGRESPAKRMCFSPPVEVDLARLSDIFLRSEASQPPLGRTNTPTSEQYSQPSGISFALSNQERDTFSPGPSREYSPGPQSMRMAPQISSSPSSSSFRPLSEDDEQRANRIMSRRLSTEELAIAMETMPKNAAAKCYDYHFTEARKFLAQHNLKEALAHIELAMSYKYNEPVMEALFFKMDVLFKLGHDRQAEKFREEVLIPELRKITDLKRWELYMGSLLAGIGINEKVTEDEAYYRDIISFTQSGKFPEALDLCDAFISRFQNCSEIIEKNEERVLSCKIQILAKLDMPSQGLALADWLIRKYGNKIALRIHKAWCLLLMGNKLEAMRFIKETLEAAPQMDNGDYRRDFELLERQYKELEEEMNPIREKARDK